MLVITIEANNITIDNKNLTSELNHAMVRVIERQKHIINTNVDGKVQVYGKRDDLYTLLFNLAILFDIELR